MTAEETKSELESSLDGFQNYITSLASGKLDGFLDSLQHGDKAAGLGVYLPLDPILLLHDLGNYPNQERIEELFTGDTVSVVSRPM